MRLFNKKKSEPKQVPNLTVVSMGDAKRVYTPELSQGTIVMAMRQADAGKLQAINKLYDRLQKNNPNLASAIDTRAEAIKAIEPQLPEGLSDAQAEYFAKVLEKLHPSLVDCFIESKLRANAFRQIEWELVDGKYYPKQLLSYNGLDLRDENGELVLYEKDHKKSLSELKFVALRRDTPILWGLLKYYLFKSFALTNYASYTEMFGKPVRLGKYKPGATKDEKDELFNIIQSAGTDLGAMISENVLLEFIELKNQNGTGVLFKDLVALCEKAETKRILGQTLTTDAEKAGTFAQAKVANLVRMDILSADVREYRIFLSQFLSLCNHINFGADDVQAKLPIPQDVDLTQRIAIDEKLYNNIGLPMDDDYFYRTYGVPNPAKQKASAQAAVVRSRPRTPVTASTRFVAKVRKLSSFRRTASRLQKAAIAQLNEVIDKQIRTQVAKAERLSDLIYLDTAPLAEAYEDLLKKLLELGSKTGYADGRHSADKVAKMLQLSGRMRAAADLPDLDELLDELVDFDWGDDSSAMLDSFSEEAGQVAAVQAEQLRESLVAQAERAIAEGQSFSEFRQNLQYTGWEANAPYYLRTNFTTATNASYLAGQYQQAQEVKHLFPYFQYAAIMDDKVRDAHAALNGFIAAVDDEIWGTIWPPNDWNCRCGTVQLMQHEAEDDPNWGKPANVENVDDDFSSNAAMAKSIWGGWLSRQ